MINPTKSTIRNSMYCSLLGISSQSNTLQCERTQQWHESIQWLQSIVLISLFNNNLFAWLFFACKLIKKFNKCTVFVLSNVKNPSAKIKRERVMVHGMGQARQDKTRHYHSVHECIFHLDSAINKTQEICVDADAVLCSCCSSIPFHPLHGNVNFYNEHK